MKPTLKLDCYVLNETTGWKSQPTTWQNARAVLQTLSGNNRSGAVYKLVKMKG